jgi:hypothetical protein
MDRIDRMEKRQALAIILFIPVNSIPVHAIALRGQGGRGQ